MSDLKAQTEAPREKTLHELVQEAWAIDQALRNVSAEAGEAAKLAVIDTLNEKRPDGKPTRKNLRPIP